MKKFLFRTALLCLVTAVLMGCKEDYMGGVGDFNLTVKEVGPDYVEYYVTAPSTVEMAYSVVTEPQALTAPVLFMTGFTKEISPKDVVRFDNLQTKTTYHLYAAVKLDDQNFSKVLKLDFNTKEYKFKDVLTVVNTAYDGFKIHINVPDETIERGNVLRYTGTNIAMFNMLRAKDGDAATVLEAVVANGNRHGNFVKNDSTIRRDASTSVMTDEKGRPIKDENGEYIDVHDDIVAGEPYVFYVGECTLGTDDEMGAITGWHYGTSGKTWQVPLFDWNLVDEDFDLDTADENWTGSGWTGTFDLVRMRAKEPALCDATVKIEIPEDEITAIDAKIYFDMDDEVSRYFYMVTDNTVYNMIIDEYFDLKGAPQEEIDSYMQWFITSYFAFQNLGIGTNESDTQASAAYEFNGVALEGDTEYHVFCTVMVDDEIITNPYTGKSAGDGANQRFVHKTFKTIKKVLDPPVVEVTALPAKDPYKASFNIKAPNKDLVGAYWAANYSKEFQLMLNAGYTYGDILEMNTTFKPEEIAQINTDEGLTVSVPTLDGETIRFAVYGCNSEYTFNKIDPTDNGVGWDDYLAPMAPKAADIESPLYEALEGEWTMTARLKVNELIGDEVHPYETTYSSEVKIGREIPDIPTTLPENAYKLPWDYADGVTTTEQKREFVDGLLDELHLLVDRFNEYRVQGQNRLLCTGFFDFDYYDDIKRLGYKSPYDLFVATDYTSVDVAQVVYDFGPKWFLQVLADGSVIVPFSEATLPPLTGWPGYPFYVGGVGPNGAFYESTADVPGFPVEIADDYSKITIKPIVLEDGNYYMNALGITDAYSGSMELVYTVLSDIVLTRKETSAAVSKAGAAPRSVVPADVKPVTIDGAPVSELPKARVYKSMTELKANPRKNFKVDETPDVVTVEMLNAVKERIRKQYNLE